MLLASYAEYLLRGAFWAVLRLDDPFVILLGNDIFS